ncbi:MAG: 16S rRNA (guanine(527)-N(7))-methyltransferase RsmG [Actinobacteria bacterium]|nr:16S rRNA (guanine(527)-N(7))-methyltransferase RsmG [Actinomycetota bacterium]
MDAFESLRLQAAIWGLSLDPHRLARLERYARLLRDYEEANVIGTRELRGVILDHVLDSLSCFLFEHLGAARSLVDIGTGGGLPGVPIKIVEPEIRTTLVEATAKKARFLRRVVERLSLEDVKVENARVEETARTDAHRGVYDVATARAVARLSVVAEYCVPLLRVGGYVISMKGRLEDEEIAEGERAAQKLGARFSQLIRVPRLPELEKKERCLVILEKTEETPREYPRNVGVPAKRPLGMV